MDNDTINNDSYKISFTAKDAIENEKKRNVLKDVIYTIKKGIKKASYRRYDSIKIGDDSSADFSILTEEEIQILITVLREGGYIVDYMPAIGAIHRYMNIKWKK